MRTSSTIFENSMVMREWWANRGNNLTATGKNKELGRDKKFSHL